jgi:alcohol dehydrogenase (cytochrome c)
VIALNADNGVEVWRYFTTTPGPAATSSTWAGTSWKTGGAPVWNTPAVDLELGRVYINTGNAAPDINGELRAGKNLNSSSIVALDLATGQQQWAFQQVHHDLWDYDSAQPTMLFTVMKSGQALPAVGECSKNGNYYILDRRSGTPIYPVTEVPVPTQPAWQNAWPTQPESSIEPLTPLTILPGTVDMSKLPPGIALGSRYSVPQQQTLLISPGDDGGCEWAPAAFSPRTGFVYYGTRYEPTTFHTFPGNQGPDGGGLFLGSAFGDAVPGVTDFGLFGATDTATGKVVWKIQVAQPAKSGMLVAGDVAFFGEGNGKFHAVNASSGQELWAFDGTTLPGGGGAQAGPTAYVVNGREFVVNAFGGNTADAASFPPNPVGDAIVAFSLPH